MKQQRYCQSLARRFAALAAVAMIVDGFSSPVIGQDAAPGERKFPGTKEGAERLLKQFLDPKADHQALTAPLEPTLKDYKAVFKDEAFAEKASKAYSQLWRTKPALRPKSGQTQLLLWGATSDDLNNWKGAAAQVSPGGYENIKGKFKDGLTIYRFKFVRPGERLGMAFDGLVYINGHWRLMPKPWRIR